MGVMGGWIYTNTAHTINTRTHEIHIPLGASLRSTTQKLHARGIVRFPRVLEMYLRLRQMSLHPGHRVIHPLTPLTTLMDHLTDPDKTSHTRTIIEGSSPLITRQDINADSRFSGSSIRADQMVPVMGDTYGFTPNEDRHHALTRWHTVLLAQATYLWQIGTTQDIIRSPRELIILASIIEKETALDSERRRIAGVFINRLRTGMRLQADCTVVYGLCRENPNRLWNQGLTKAELKTPSPYNTYRQKGLPPTAIANPSLGSLKAAASPLATKDLYFVADGKGGHVFSHTRQQHAKKHKKWRKIRKQTQTRSRTKPQPRRVPMHHKSRARAKKPKRRP